MQKDINFETIAVINDEIELSDKNLLNRLAEYINNLILTDFEKLVQMLYRIDVHEMKLKKMLSDHPDQEAGKIIAELIVQRQLQKIKFKKEMESKQDENCEEEKW